MLEQVEAIDRLQPTHQAATDKELLAERAKALQEAEEQANTMRTLYEQQQELVQRLGVELATVKTQLQQEKALSAVCRSCAGVEPSPTPAGPAAWKLHRTRRTAPRRHP